MKTSTDSGKARRPSAHERTGRRRALPAEIAATALALSAVLLGVAFSVPAYGIFLGWAAASLTANSTGARMPVLARCLTLGALFGAGTLTAQGWLEQLLGTAMPTWAYTVAVLALANPLMILLGRLSTLRSVPGMFIGFSTLLAVHLGGGDPAPHGILWSLLIAATTNLVGVAFQWLFVRMTSRPRIAQADAIEVLPHASSLESVVAVLPASRADAGLEPRMRA